MIKNFIRFILQISIIGYIRNQNKIKIKDKYFENIRKYFEKTNAYNKSKNSSIILVDALILHAGYITNGCLIASGINRKGGKIIYGLTRFNNDWPHKFIMKNYYINNFISIYRHLNLIVIFRAIIAVLRNIKLNYNKNSGIKFYLNNDDVGEYIYDHYLRQTNLGTKRKISIDYYGFCFRCSYYYYRYLQIIKNYDITDIVIGHNVYSDWGFLSVAARHSGKKIKIINWQDFTYKNILSITKQLSAIKIRKHGYLSKDSIKQLTIKSVDKEFNDNYAKKLEGKYSNKDSVNVFKNAEIHTIKSFKENYIYDEKKTNIFIFSHAFVDQVKYARWNLYSDHLTWLEETLEILSRRNQNCNYYIKPHPSEFLYKTNINACDIVKNANNIYGEKFIFLDKNISNKLIFELAEVIITNSGTVSVEAPCFGIKCIVSGETPSEQLEVNKICRSVEEYELCLSNLTESYHISDYETYISKKFYLWYTNYMFIKTGVMGIGDSGDNDIELIINDLSKINDSPSLRNDLDSSLDSIYMYYNSNLENSSRV